MIEDIHECEAGIEKYDNEINKVIEEINKYKNMLTKNNEDVNKLDNILSLKKENHTLGDLIDYQTHKKMCSNFNEKLNEIRAYLDEKTAKVDEIKKVLRQINKRAKEIKTDFLGILKINRNKLEANTWNIDKVNKICINNIKDSGSNVSRAIIAYRFALLEIVKKYGSIITAPFIADTPAGQQDQDDEYAKQIIKFIFENRPDGIQMIIASRDMKGYTPIINFHKIEFKEKHNLLYSDAFLNVNDIFTKIDEKIKNYIISKQ